MPRFPFSLVLFHLDSATFERIEGFEPGRPMVGETKPTIPALQHEPRPLSARWGTDHGCRKAGVEATRQVFPLGKLDFAGVWYDDLDAWASAWSATITSRRPCDRFGTAQG